MANEGFVPAPPLSFFHRKPILTFAAEGNTGNKTENFSQRTEPVPQGVVLGGSAIAEDQELPS